MGALDDFRQQYPAYKDVPDQALADALYEKFYSGKVARGDYYKQLGLEAPKFDASSFGSITKQAAKDLGTASLDLAHNVATGAVRGAGGLVDYAAGATLPQFGPLIEPGSKMAEGFFKNVMPPYQPQTLGGRMIQGAAAGAASTPFNPALAGISAASGATTELAADLSNNNPAVTIPTSLVAPLVFGGPAAIRGNASRMLQRRMGGMTEADFARGQQYENLGQQIGFPLSAAESLDNPALRSLAGDVAASRTGGPAMQRFFDQRADQSTPTGQRVYGQFSSVMTPLLDQIAPRTESTGDVANRVQRAAENVIQRTEQTRSDLVRPFYQAGENTPVAPNEVLQVIGDIDARLANNPPAAVAQQLRALRGDLVDANGNPLQTAGQLDNVYKIWRERTQLPPTDANNLQKGVAAQLPTEDVGNLAVRASPDIAYGRSLYGDLSQTTVGPTRRSEVGQLANRAGIPENIGLPGQLNIITNPKTARPEGITFIANALNSADPQAFPQIARTYLENAFNEASKRLQSGPNRALGAKFVNLVAATDDERANLRAVLQGVARAQGLPDDALWPGFRNAISVMERSGTIPGVGSPTATRGAAMAEASATPLDAGNPVGYIRRTWGDLMNGRAYRQLAEVFTAPNSIQAMRELAMLNPNSARANVLVASMLGWRPEEARDKLLNPQGR